MPRIRLTLALILCAIAPLAAQGGGLVNIAGAQYGTRVTADTEFSAEYAGSRVADGSLARGSGCWYSKDQTTLPCAVTFELSQPETIGAVILHQAEWGGNMYHTRAFTVEVSDDGGTWRPVGTGELPDESLAKLTVGLPDVHTRLLRVVVQTSYNSFQTCGLAEVELLAKGLPGFGPAQYELNGSTETVVGAHCGLAIVAPGSGAEGPQVSATQRPAGFTASVEGSETVAAVVGVTQPGEGCTLTARARLTAGSPAQVALCVEGGPEVRRTLRDSATLSVGLPAGEGLRVRLLTAATERGGPAARRSRRVLERCAADQGWTRVPRTSLPVSHRLWRGCSAGPPCAAEGHRARSHRVGLAAAGWHRDPAQPFDLHRGHRAAPGAR